MVQNIFSEYLDDTLKNADLYDDDHTKYSRWCSGERPVPHNIIELYEENHLWDSMEQDFRNKIIPNLINETQARLQTESLLTASVNAIGNETFQEMISLSDNATFFTAILRYPLLNDHCQDMWYSPSGYFVIGIRSILHEGLYWQKKRIVRSLNCTS